MTMISRPAQDRRENARRLTGEFGTQPHAESGIVNPGPPAVMFTQKAFLHSSSALFSESCIDVYRWARAADIDADHIDDLDMQLALHSMWEADEAEAVSLTDADEDLRWASAEARMKRILAEAERRTTARAELAATILTDEPLPKNGWIMAAMRRDMKAAERLQLLPDGVTASVELMGGIRNPQIMVILKGLPDRLGMTQTRNSENRKVDVPSAYANRLRDMVARMQTRYYAADGPRFEVMVENDRGAKARAAGDALAKAEKQHRAAIRTGHDTTLTQAAVLLAKNDLYNTYA